MCWKGEAAEASLRAWRVDVRVFWVFGCVCVVHRESEARRMMRKLQQWGGQRERVRVCAGAWACCALCPGRDRGETKGRTLMKATTTVQPF